MMKICSTCKFMKIDPDRYRRVYCEKDGAMIKGLISHCSLWEASNVSSPK